MREPEERTEVAFSMELCGLRDFWWTEWMIASSALTTLHLPCSPHSHSPPFAQDHLDFAVTVV